MRQDDEEIQFYLLKTDVGFTMLFGLLVGGEREVPIANDDGALH